MNVVRDENAGLRWLNTFYAEAQRQAASAPQPHQHPQKKKKRETAIPRYAHSR